MKTFAGIGKKSRERLKAVIEASSDNVLTAKLVAKTLALPQTESARLLSRWHNAGWLRRVKRGMYWPLSLEYDPETPVEDPWIIADRVFAPGYIGGFSAIKHWDFSEQLFSTDFYFTIKPVISREIIIGESKLKLKTIKNYKLFGTKSVWRNNVKINISDPSKTIVDLLDDPALGGGMRTIEDFFMEYWNTEYKDIKLLIQYIKKVKNRTIFKRLGFLLEVNNLIDSNIFNFLQKHISSGYSNFDPSVKNIFCIRKWNLKISRLWKKKYDYKKRST